MHRVPCFLTATLSTHQPRANFFGVHFYFLLIVVAVLLNEIPIHRAFIYLNGLFVIAESGSGDDIFIIRLRDLWRERANVDIYYEDSISSLYDELRQQEQAKQRQQSPTQVVSV